MFKNLRVAIFNWFAAGKMTLTKYEDKPMSTYTIGGNGAGVLSINPNGNMGYSTGGSAPQTSQTMTIKITPANGGTIIQLHLQEYSAGELYIIPDGADFDRELGKIITMSKLKA